MLITVLYLATPALEMCVNGQINSLINQTNVGYLMDAAMQERFHKDMASRAVCNLSQAMALNSTLDGDQCGFIHLWTKAGTAVNGMFGHYGCFRECLLCGRSHNSHRCSSCREISQRCFNLRM